MAAAAKSNARIGWVDIAKAFSIAAIVVGHLAAFFCSTVPWAHDLLEFCYSFHVPLFFILSGYTSKPGLIPPRKLLKLIRTTFLPYIVTGAAIIGLCLAVNSGFTLEEWLAALAYGQAAYRSDPVFFEPFGTVGIGAIWFLPALFIGKLLAASFSKAHPFVRMLLAAALFTFGEVSEGLYTLPFGFQGGCCATWYITCGMMMGEYKLFEREGWEKNLLAIVSMLGLGYIVALTTGTLPEPNYCLAWYHNGALDAVGVVLASIFVMEVSQLVGSWHGPVQRFLEMVGRSTLPLFCWHAVSIAPDTLIFPWVEQTASGMDNPALMMFGLIVLDFAIIAALSVACRFIPGLRHVYFPGQKSLFAKEAPDALAMLESQRGQHVDVSASEPATATPPYAPHRP